MAGWDGLALATAESTTYRQSQNPAFVVAHSLETDHTDQEADDANQLHASQRQLCCPRPADPFFGVWVKCFKACCSRGHD
jgi:hypothetical protein